MAKRHDPAQEAFFATDAHGHISDAEVAGEYVVDPISQRIHLINALDGLAQMSSLDGLIMAAGSGSQGARIEDQFHAPGKVVAESTRMRQWKLGKEIRYEFARAHGMFARIDAGEDAAIVKAEIKALYTDFIDTYGHIRNAEARHKYRMQLDAEIKSYQQAATDHNEAEASRPHLADKERSDQGLDTLSSTERLRAIYEDSRAGFLPTTHTEKTMVMAALDYLDNPQYRLGIRNQALEIARFHKKKGNDPTLPSTWQEGREYGLQAAVSRTYEIGDFLMDAQRQLDDFRALQVMLYKPIRPTLTLQDAIGSYHDAYAGLTRFRDLEVLRHKGEEVATGLPHHPLHPYRNETADVLSGYPGKHKVLEDPYTRTDPEDEFAAKIAQFPEETTVHEARKLLGRAIDDAEKRRRFMLELLQSYTAQTQERVLKPARAAATLILSKYAELVPLVEAA